MKLRNPFRNSAEPPAEPAPAPAPVLSPHMTMDLSINAGGPRLGEMLVDAQLATREQVMGALADAGPSAPKLLGQRLIAEGVLDERAVARVVAVQHGLEVVDLREVTPDPEAIRLLDEATARDKSDKKTVEVAVEAYRAKTSAYPAALGNLVPDYLRELPNSPEYTVSYVAATGAVSAALTDGTVCA